MRYRTRQQVVTALMLVLISMLTITHAATMEVKIIQLRNRTAESMIPLIKPFLPRGGGASGSGFDLIIKTTPDNFEQIQEVVQKLDVPAQQLMISVKQSGSSSRKALLLDVNDRQFRAGSNTGQSQAIQKINTMDGTEAYINVKQSVPYVQTVNLPNGQLTRNVMFRDVNTGFYVLPRVAGNEVTLELNQQSGSYHQQSGNIDEQSTATVIRARLGQWVRVGGVAESSSSSGYGIIFSKSRQRDTSSTIYLRVDVAN